MSEISLTGRIVLAAWLVLSAASPAAAQLEDDFPMETRALLAALASAEEAVEDLEYALTPSDSAEAAPDTARRLRQRGLESAVEAARADQLLRVVAALRAEAGAEPPLHDEEIELQLLLGILQAYGDDLVEIDDCADDAPPFDYDRAVAQAAPTFARVRELGDLIEVRLQAELGRPEDRP